MQTKKWSMIETVLSTAIGFVIALLSQHFLFPLWGIEVEWHDNFQIACVFTIISIVRGYFVRRMFNLMHVKGIM